MSRSVTILGSTGSIGRSTIDLLLKNPEAFAVEALVAKKDVATLATQALALNAKMAVVEDDSYYSHLKEALAGTGITVAAGMSGVIEAAQAPAEWVMSAIVGIAGLRPTYAAIERGAIIALANKESMISAGPVVLEALKKYKATLLPVDSEHNAIFQVFQESHRAHVEKLILTASGGPFRTFSPQEMTHITPEQALKHPNWSMGPKVTIDSSNLMNKGLEMIEAAYLFGFPEDQIDILIHPQSIVHSLVAYRDGSVLAQLGIHDMRVPIAYTLAWPARMETDLPRLDLCAIRQLTFEAPDAKKFPAISLARNVLKMGKNRPTILNAANEIAVQAFLDKKISYLDIVSTCSDVLDQICESTAVSIEDILLIDQQARHVAEKVIHKKMTS
ncbi:MAG: 1-deoxy-D-xylulose-5-phosphate reductoisomerase [Alphaproteobacteria bacterium]|jgi:1-deoxy-D-xylulose-5-phosphate reductoisomerase|nr:1-deoxy-D-xylulose-5-phosphate reductoisomerase [Alphaproteobacteria bacterium]